MKQKSPLSERFPPSMLFSSWILARTIATKIRRVSSLSPAALCIIAPGSFARSASVLGVTASRSFCVTLSILILSAAGPRPIKLCVSFEIRTPVEHQPTYRTSPLACHPWDIVNETTPGRRVHAQNKHSFSKSARQASSAGSSNLTSQSPYSAFFTHRLSRDRHGPSRLKHSSSVLAE